MDYKALLEKYNALLEEIDRLTKENHQLKAQLGLLTSALPPSPASATTTEEKILGSESIEGNCSSIVDGGGPQNLDNVLSSKSAYKRSR